MTIGPQFELHGAETGNCLRVAVTLELLGMPYTPINVKLRMGEHRTSEFLRMNPAGKVPVLIDRFREADPLILTQSNAIMLHLCEMRPGALLPTDERHRAKTLSRFFYFVTDIIGPSGDAFVLRGHGDMPGAAVLSDRVDAAIGLAEGFLADAAHMAGELFSLADVAALTVIRANRERLPWNRLPLMKRWLERVLDIPEVQRGLRVFSN